MHDLVETPSATESVAQLVILGKSGSSTLDLHEGQSALVGQAAGCQLRLDGDNVAPHQCMLELQDGILMLDNWSDDESTKVNDKFVKEQVTLDSGDTISFGGYRIQFRFGADDAPETQEVMGVSDFSDTVETQKLDSVESSTIAVLYSEIDFLQRELEQRDAAMAQVTSSAKNDSTKQAEWTCSKKRMNELMAELQVADNRLLCLTDELRFLEDVRAAEQEEQRQVTAWVNEVESLIAKRESEQLAQSDVLRAQLAQEKEDRLFHQRRADAIAADDSKNDIQVALTDLRMEYEALREEYKDATARVEQLELECETLRAANMDAAVEKRIQDAVREEQLELAQERAKLSRREHDLAEKLRQVDSEMAIKQPGGEDDAKIEAFREKLKEFQDYQAECEPISPGQRLVKLWQSLDGRSS